MKNSDPIKSLHPKNLHHGRYDLDSLCETLTELTPFVFENQFGTRTLDFANPEAVKLLNKALLLHYYKVRFWDIPDGFLCPPIPGRADYLHYAADLLAENESHLTPKGAKIHVLDIGTGANLIYPILANAIFGWKVMGSEINPVAIQSARKIIEENPQMSDKIQVAAQINSDHIFQNIIQKEAFFDLTICNPPFHDSAESAAEGSLRKLKNLKQNPISKVELNFGGQAAELWCPGGEVAFIQKMISESVSFRNQVLWFTSLVSKIENLKPIEGYLQKVGVSEYKIVPMAQGNKQSRFIAWTFLNSRQQKSWRNFRWT